MLGRVYIERNKVNAKVYVGSTMKKLAQRHIGHISGASCHPNVKTKWYEAIRELGAENFYIELLEEVEVESREELVKREYEWIAKFDPEELYNTELEFGKKSASTREKLRQANLGKVLTEETREKIRQAKLGTKHTDETKEKMRQAHLGKVLTEEHKLNLSEALKGKCEGADNPNFKRGCITKITGRNSFRFEWQENGKKRSKPFNFGVKSPWDREEAYYFAQKFRQSIFPEEEPEPKPASASVVP